MTPPVLEYIEEPVVPIVVSAERQTFIILGCYLFEVTSASYFSTEAMKSLPTGTPFLRLK